MRTSLALAAALALVAVTAAADQEVTHSFSTSVPRGHIRRVIVDIPAGDVRVRNGQASTIALNGDVRRSYDGWREHEKEQQIIDDVGAEIYVNGDEAVVRRRFGSRAHSWSSRNHSDFNVRLEVPQGVDVILETKYGDVDLDGTFGNVECDLRAGEIRVRTPRANVRDLSASVRVGEVHANLGDETISKEGLFPGTMTWVNASGRADLHVHTTFGEVHVTLTR
jgi:Putative adhesin